jgi:hypothetical protein
VSEHADTYKVLETGAVNWLEIAEGLQTSAKLSWDALWSLSNQPPAEVFRDRMAYMASFMLLTAFAFENVCRGIATLTKEEGWKYLRKHGGGHKISHAVPEFVSVSDDELKLLKRLETYSVWAGRYLIPLDPKDYVSACEDRLRTVRSMDRALSDQLFARLKTQLEIHRLQLDAAN